MKNQFLQRENTTAQSLDKALVLISGATSGSQGGFEALDVLRKNNLSLIPVVSNSALKTYGLDNLLSMGGFSTIFTEENFDNVDIVKNVRLVYLPVITTNLVGKLAHGIYDELLATIIFHTQMAGIPIVGTIDGASPQSEDFVRRGYKSPPPGLVTMLKGNLSQIAMQEINLYPAVEVAKRLCALLGFRDQEENVSSPKAVTRSLEKRIITQSDLLGLENTNLELPEKGIVTDLAKEYADRNNINLKFKI